MSWRKAQLLPGRTHGRVKPSSLVRGLCGVHCFLCTCFSHASVPASGTIEKILRIFAAGEQKPELKITTKIQAGKKSNGRNAAQSSPHPLHPRPVLAGTRTGDILLIRLRMPSWHWAQSIHRIAGAIMGKQYRKVVKRARRKQYVARVKALQRQAQKDRNST